MSVLQLYIVGQTLYQCILRVYGQFHYVQSIRIDNLFVKTDWAFSVLIPMMFTAKSWKIVKISKKNEILDDKSFEHDDDLQS